MNPERALFHQNRVPSLEKPSAPSILTWVLAVAVPLLVPVFLFSPLKGELPPGPMILTSLAGFIALGLVIRYLRARHRYCSRLHTFTGGTFSVTFDRRWKRMILAGPIDPREAEPPPEEHTVMTLPLNRAHLHRSLHPTHPFSDMGYEADDYRAVSLSYRIDSGDRPPLPDFEGDFDLLSDLQPDFRWYVTIDHPELARRESEAQALLSGNDPGSC